MKSISSACSYCSEHLQLGNGWRWCWPNLRAHGAGTPDVSGGLPSGPAAESWGSCSQQSNRASRAHQLLKSSTLQKC